MGVYNMLVCVCLGTLTLMWVVMGGGGGGGIGGWVVCHSGNFSCETIEGLCSPSVSAFRPILESSSPSIDTPGSFI